MSAFTGTCIGGPLDGQVRTSEAPTLRAAWPIREVEPFHATDALAILTREEMTYRFEHWRTTKREFGMWVPSDVPIEAALEALFVRYRRHAEWQAHEPNP